MPEARAQSATGNPVEQIEVTGTRVNRAGFVAPTPTTVVSADDIAVGGSASLSQFLYTLPSFAPTVSAPSLTDRGGAVQSIANLRDLGTSRTLVLIDGARPVPTASLAPVYGFDLNAIPSFLIKRVDIVTGGASAQWGSDAVAGVINVVLDNEFEGLKGQIQDGSDMRGYSTNEFVANVAYGTSFSNGRGHVMFGAGYDKTDGAFSYNKTAAGQDGLIPNPNYTATNGQPKQLFVSNLLNNNASTGGLITAGPLKGIDFGPGGSIGTFQYGTYGTLASSGVYMVGGDATARNYYNSYVSIVSPLTRTNFYGRASYDVTSDITMKADLLLAYEGYSNPTTPFVNLGNLTIQNTNAYLPNQIKTLMAQNNVTSFAFGRDNEEFGAITARATTFSQQFKIGFDGHLGSDLAWDAFYSYGQTEHHYAESNNPISANYANSINAVISPTSGQPVCAIALTNPTTNCVPVNLFGQGSVTQAAMSYFLGTAYLNQTHYQHELGANLHGEPFSLWAGPVSVATGMEFREVGLDSANDAISKTSGFGYVNYPNIASGSYTVTEGYIETVVPLAKSLPLMDELNFNGAVRVSGYSTTGISPSYKLGLTDSVLAGLLLRATISQDVRAPNFLESNTGTTTGLSSVTNTATGITNGNVTTLAGGNPALKPELGQTWTVGATYQPGWIDGFSGSIDYYNIKVANAIVSLSAQAVANLCYTNNLASACSNVTTSNGAITQVRGGYTNLSAYKTSGIDLELNYATSLQLFGLDGQLSAKSLTTYVTLLKQYTGGVFVPLAGDITASAGLPRVRSNLTLNYDVDPFGVMARVRFVGGGEYSLQQTVNTNVKGQAYLDLGVNWNLPFVDKANLYFNVNNVLNNVNSVASTANPALYDFIGTTYNVGVKVAL
jgi:outer membrane receptor protein involved in Fe transport